MSQRIKQAARRYTIEMLVAMLLYMAVLVGSLTIAKEVEGGLLPILLALSPVVPLLFAFAAFLRFYRRMDERQKRISADAAAITLMIGILAAVTLGFLQGFEVIVFKDDMLWFAPFLFTAWGMTRFFLGGRDC